MKIISCKKSKFKMDYFFIKGNIKINHKYFISKIEKDILENNNKSFVTNVIGEMTDWKSFNSDIEFAKILFKFFDFIDQKKLINKSYYLSDSWGIKESFSHYTAEHSHQPSIISAVLYLSTVNQKLLFPEINEEINAEIGNFALFSGVLKHKTNQRINFGETKYAISFNCSVK